MWSFACYRQEKYTPSFLSRAKTTSCNQEVYREKQYVCISNTHTHTRAALPLHVITSLSFRCCHGNSCSFPTKGNKLKLVEESCFWCHVNTRLRPCMDILIVPFRSAGWRLWFRWPLVSRHNKPASSFFQRWYSKKATCYIDFVFVLFFCRRFLYLYLNALFVF